MTFGPFYDDIVDCYFGLLGLPGGQLGTQVPATVELLERSSRLREQIAPADDRRLSAFEPSYCGGLSKYYPETRLFSGILYYFGEVLGSAYEGVSRVPQNGH